MSPLCLTRSAWVRLLLALVCSAFATPPARSAAPPLAGPRRDVGGEALPDEALCRLGSTRLRHAGQIFFLSFAQNGKILVSRGQDGIRLWDAASGRLLKHLETVRGGPASLTPDGRFLACGGSRLELWNLAEGRRLVAPVEEDGISTWSVCYSPDGLLLAAWRHSAGLKGALPTDWAGVLDARSGKVRCSLGKGAEFVQEATFSRDGKWLVTSGSGNALYVWDAQKGEKLRTIPLGKEMAGQVVLSPDGKSLAALCGSEAVPTSVIRLWSLVSGERLGQFRVKGRDGRPDSLLRFLFAPDGKRVLAEGSSDLVLLDCASGEEVRRYPRPFRYSVALAVSPDGRTAATAARYGGIHLLDLTSGKDRFPSVGHGTPIVQAFCSADGRLAATVGWLDDQILIWSVPEGRELGRLEGTRGGVADVVLLAGGRQAASVDSNGTCRLWNLERFRQADFSLPAGLPLALSPDGKKLALHREDYSLCLVDSLAPARRVMLATKASHVNGVAFTRNGRHLVGVLDSGLVKRWDARSGKVEAEFPLPYPLTVDPHDPDSAIRNAVKPVFSTDGAFLAYTVPSLKEIVIVDLARRSILHRVGQASEGDTLSFSPDGKTLAWTRRGDRAIHLLEVASGRERHALPGGGPGQPLSATFSGGVRLISTETDATGLIWDLSGRLWLKGEWGRALGPAGLDRCWTDLGGAHAGRAFRASRLLIGSPEEAVALVAREIPSAAGVLPAVLARLIADLSHDDFEVRQQASQRLEDLGEAVLPGCRKALAASPDLETTRRLEKIIFRLERPRAGWSRQRLRELRAVEVLEAIDTPQARALLRRLAGGVPEAGLTEDARFALERMELREKE